MLESLLKKSRIICAMLVAGGYISYLAGLSPVLCEAKEAEQLTGPEETTQEINVTDVFEPVTHASVTVDTLVCNVYDDSEFQKLSRQVIKWTEDKSKARLVMETFEQLLEKYDEASTSQMLAYIRLCENPLDEQMDTVYRQNCTVKLEMSNIILETAQAICDSPCDFTARLTWSEEFYRNIQQENMLTDEQQQLYGQETQWISEYKEAFQKQYGTDQYKKRNEDIGAIYLNLIAVRKQIAESFGYETYPDYAYETIYGKEYTVAETASFREEVKTYVVPFLKQLSESIDWDKISVLDQENYDTQHMLDLLETYLPKISSEMSESLSYMEENKLYNWDANANKMKTNYTTMLVSYRAPYIYRYPVNGFLNLKTTVHEFGHYNACYYVPDEGWGSSQDYDLAEVHSQGLEMLFLDFYPEIFGDNGDAAVKYVLYLLVNNMVEGCLYDEFQQYAYTKENVTLEELNREFYRLCVAYGKLPEDKNYDQLYSWIEVPHNFESPFYYISYAFSAETALQLGMDALDNRQLAIQNYLLLVKESKEKSYLELLDECGMASPFDNQKLEQLIQDIKAYAGGEKIQQPMSYQTTAPSVKESPTPDRDVPLEQEPKQEQWKERGILGGGILIVVMIAGIIVLRKIKIHAKDDLQN